MYVCMYAQCQLEPNSTGAATSGTDCVQATSGCISERDSDVTSQAAY